MKNSFYSTPVVYLLFGKLLKYLVLRFLCVCVCVVACVTNKTLNVHFHNKKKILINDSIRKNTRDNKDIIRNVSFPFIIIIIIMFLLIELTLNQLY